MSDQSHSSKEAMACLNSQGRSTSPHGPGGAPPKPADSVGKGAGMGYHPAKAASCLNEWGREKDAPDNHGPHKSY